MNDITSDFSEIPTAYPPATGFDSIYVAEIATISELVVLDSAIIPGILPSIDTIAIAETLDLSDSDHITIVRWTAASRYAPATYAQVSGDPGTGAAFQDAVGTWFSIAEAAISVWMLGAVGDSVTDDAAAINRTLAAAAGLSTAVVPATAGFYLILSTPVVPSNTYLIVEVGAAIRTGNNANCSGLQLAANASNIEIDLFGTLDGNAANQPVGVGTSGGIVGGPGNAPCQSVYIRGGRTGTITGWKNWPVNLLSATNCELNGLNFADSGNSVEFAGISTRINVVTGSYTTASGAITLNTGAAPHGISVGQTFTYVAATGSASAVQGEYVALTVPDAFTVTTQAAAGLVGGNPTLITGRVGTCAKCVNVGIVDCTASNIRDLGLGFYGGVVGGYIRNCDMQVGASGPFIFSDVGQPGSNEDCEISGCYTHDGYGGGPTSTSGQAGISQHNSRIFNNTVRNCARGGITVSACDGVDVYGNNLIGNLPAFDGASQQCGQLLVGGGVTGPNIWGNTILEPGQSSTAQTTFFVVSASSTYNSTTGAVSLTTTAPSGVAVGDRFLVFDLFGQGNYLALNGWQTATAGTGGDTVNYTGPTGLGTITFMDSVTPGARLTAFTFAVSTTLVAGTYTSDSSGNLSLVTAAPNLMTTGDAFVLSGVGGTGVPGYMNAQFTAAAGTTGTTLNIVILPGVTMTISSGKVLPANFGIALDAPDYCQISGNTIADNQSPALLTTCLGGTWGSFGASGGNSFGPRLAVSPDTSSYGVSNINGLNYDLLFSIVVGNAIIAGSMTFQGVAQQSGATATYFQTRGLTPSWNENAGAGDVDFLCGRGAGGAGGFNFLQVSPITVSSGTYNSGTGAVVMATRVPHQLLPGSVFTVSAVTGTGADIALLNGVQTATVGTTGSTLDFTDSTGLTIATITGATIVPAGTPGGVIDTTRGFNGSLFANDGLGNSGLGGALVHRATQIAALVNGGTVTVNANTSFVLVQNAASIATASIVLPAPVAGQFAGGFNELEINVQNPIGALTVTAATGASVVNAPTAIAAAGNSVNFINVGTIWTRRIMV